MDMYIALKPCKFAGKKYMVNDIVPTDVVLTGRAEALKNAGVIAEAPEEENDEAVQVTIALKSGKNVICTDDEITGIFNVLQSTVAEAETLIADEDSENVLDVLFEADSRKGVKTAVTSRIESIKGEAETEAEAETADTDVKGDA